MKFDRQIVAIAKSNGAKLIVSDDDGVRACAQGLGIKSLKVAELDFPEHAMQSEIDLDVHVVRGGEAQEKPA